MATPSTGSVSSNGKPNELHDGRITTWLPLTTAFPSVSGCESSFYSYVSNTLAAWDPGYGKSVNQAVICQPSEVTTWWLSQREANTITSLGPVVCPKAYITAYSSIKDESSTFIACCPSGYAFLGALDPGNTGQCSSGLFPGQVISYGVRPNNSGVNWTTTASGILAPTAVVGIQVNGWIFAATFTTSPTSMISTTSISPILMASASFVAATNGGQPATELSVGTKAGIGVGVSISVLLVSILISMLLWRRRRQQKSQVPLNIPLEKDVPPAQEAFRMQELDTRTKIGESGTSRSELPAHSP